MAIALSSPRTLPMDVTDQLLLDPLYYPIAPSSDDLVEYAEMLDWEGKEIAVEWAIAEVKNWMQGFVRAGLILEKISRFCLWKRHASQFGEFCEKHLKMTQWHAIRLIKAAQCTLHLARAGFDILPKNESQARPLTKFAGDELIEKWAQVTDSLPPHRITAMAICERLDEGDPAPKKRKIAVDGDTYDAIALKAARAGMSVGEFLKRLVAECDPEELAEFDPEPEEEIQNDDGDEPEEGGDPLEGGSCPKPKSKHQRWLDDLKQLLDESDPESESGDSS